MLTKTELKTLWGKHDFRPIKRLGQNFLIDKNVKEKILKNIELDSEDIVIEIGAGFAEITLDLAGQAKKVFAFEKDKKIVTILKNAFTLPSNITLLQEDFLDADIEKIARHGKIVVYGNIPYFVTSPIIEKLIKNISLIKCAYLLMQREVADRILAAPGSRKIGRLSLYVQYYTEPKRVFKVGKDAFYPAPKVESTLLRLDPLPNRRVRVRDENVLFDIIKKAYNQRRKTILNSLSGKGVGKEKVLSGLKSAKIDPFSRAEDLSLQDFARLANTL
ncbi:MAG: ribosomal RNA small subunit methyltransferase A [Candidatus Omnitrophica bacterium]|nr:ribosomal RNA small subunit methyltransferase A [Candidatus Omnitrophota bacterium]